MEPAKDYAIRELGRQKITLRADLVFTPHNSRDGAYYVVEDPVNSKFHRVGLCEYAFISLLDGDTEVGDALQTVAETSPEYALSESEAASVCKWLIESELAQTLESSQPNRLVDKARSVQRTQSWQRWNPIIFRLPLFRPNRLFEALTPWGGWMHSRPAFVAWLAVTALGAYHVMADWDRFLASSQGILAPGNWLWLLLSWLVLKIVHEVSHGVACRRYGGAVREAGVLLILFAPIAYIDVTSSWRFRSKWQRIHVAAAGMYIEMFIAALAALVWSGTGAGPLSNVCHNLVIMASFVTLMINANPLMRFDGYYIFSDLLEIPNLYADGQQYLTYWARRYVLGIPVTRPSWSRSRSLIVPLYGTASLCWRIMVSACLLIAATTLFRGAGVVLAVLAAMLWFGMPVGQCFRNMYRAKAGQKPSLARLVVLVGLAVVVFPGFLFAVPWPGARRAPAVVEYSPCTPVRAASSGFVRELLVFSGQHVEKGQVLAILKNDQLHLDAAQLRIEVEQAELNCRIFKEARQMAAYQAEKKNLESLETKSREKASQVAQLVLHAPVSGKVIRRDLDSTLGTYMSEGTELLSIGSESHKELRISISQEDLDAFKASLGQAVIVRLPYMRQFQDELHRIKPRASAKIPHPALCAAQDGPLAVKEKDPTADSREEFDHYELLAPRFCGIVEMGPDRSRRLRAGQIGSIRVRTGQESIGGHLYNLVAGWVRGQMRQRA